MNVAQLLARAAQVYPTRPALYSGTILLADYGQLATRVTSGTASSWCRNCGERPWMNVRP